MEDGGRGVELELEEEEDDDEDEEEEEDEEGEERLDALERPGERTQMR